MKRPSGPVSLKGRALRYLAMREHSRAELERKLARHAVDDSAAPDAAEVGARITAVLDELAASGLLSEQRAAEALVTAQARRFGAAKLQQNLRLRGVAPEVAAAALATVKASEFERAEAVWRRRFGVPAQDPSDRARQARFLTARGFSADIVRRLVRGLIDD